MSAALSFAPLLVQVGTPIKLAMQRLWLGGRVLPAGARLTVQHVFRSAEDKPLEIIYAFPLPRDAALRAFRITGEGFEAHSELRPVDEAIKTYEKGIAEGSLAALAREHGDGVVNLTVGNIRPKETVTVYLEILAGVELRDDGFRFRFPFTLAPAYHKQMRSSSEGDEGEIELPSDQFGDVILPPFRKDASSLHEVGFELSLALGLPTDEIASPSHSIRVKREPLTISLTPERDVPDRDLVLDVRYTKANSQVLAGPVADGKHSFAAIVPSTTFGEKPSGPRRTVILLDRSGSMQGTPIAQARKAIEACLGVLAENDSFGLVAFDDKIETLDSGMLSGSRENRDRARQFLTQLGPRGGTDLATGVEAAARMLGQGGDILVLTDGQVAGTEQILAQARATGARLFCLGIGSASEDRFLTLLSRETGGVSRFVTPRERVDLSAVDLFASMSRPVASGLQAGPDVQPEPPKSVFTGTPVLLLGETADQSIEVTWDGGRTSLQIPAGDHDTGETVRLLRGSRLITDWESRYPSQEALASIESVNRIALLLSWSSGARNMGSPAARWRSWLS
jgi:Ca-activated chloride channel homolog